MLLAPCRDEPRKQGKGDYCGYRKPPAGVGGVRQWVMITAGPCLYLLKMGVNLPTVFVAI